ncbi:RING finger protein 223-like [Oryzias latipes]|uniref:RING finger protein 223-like n=1 Tax=Oryzias latipes TaxID=8090 RepID=UPI0009DADEC8|nr:RING finger protein 223-like [Oryzias latipes]
MTDREGGNGLEGQSELGETRRKLNEDTDGIWDLLTRGGGDDLSDKSSVVSQLECSVCCSTFDNIFRTPKLLDCTHTFCLECLSRLRTISPAPQVLNGESKHLTCPICRRPTTLPPEGPPALTTNLAVLCQLPRHQQQEEPVWLEGKKLFCKSSKGGSGPESALCVYIGESKAVGGPLQTNQQYEQMDRRSKYKKSVFCVLCVLLAFTVSWSIILTICIKSGRTNPDPIAVAPLNYTQDLPPNLNGFTG